MVQVDNVFAYSLAGGAVNFTNEGVGSISKSGLVSYWSLEENSGNRIDSHSGLIFEDPNSVVSSVAAKINNGASFTGNTIGLRAANSNDSKWDIFSSDATVAFWFNHQNTNTYPILLKKGLEGLSTYQIQIKLKPPLGFLFNFYTNLYEIPFEVESNRDYHFLLTYTLATKTAELFIDSISIGTVTHTSSYFNNSSHLVYLGGHDTNSNFSYTGWIDELGVWNRILSSSEISDLYNSGNGVSFT